MREAHRDTILRAPRTEEWLLIEWPAGEAQRTKYWLSKKPQDIDFERLVDEAKLRWRIERDEQELKQELGLGHYEGRGWRGFHHHDTLCIAAYSFLIAERARLPPSGGVAPRRSKRLAYPRLTDPAAPPIRASGTCPTRSRQCDDASP